MWHLLISHGALVPSAEGGRAAVSAHMSLADCGETHTALRAVCTLSSRTPRALGTLFASLEAREERSFLYPTVGHLVPRGGGVYTCD